MKKLKKPPEQQCLLLNGRQLQDDRTLSHYSIQSKATLVLELPSESAIGDVFCIVLHALGNGGPIVRALMTSFHLFRAVHNSIFHTTLIFIFSRLAHSLSI